MKTAAATNIASRQNPVKQGMVARGADNLETRYKDMNGNEVFVSLSILNDYLCPGGNFAPQEAYVYLKLCEMRRLNPFERECYLVRYGGKPTIVVGKETYTKRAQRNPKYKGRKSGIVVLNRKGDIEYRKGELILKDEELVGGWCDVNVDGYIDPISAVVSFSEYCQVDKDTGAALSNWKTKPCTMIHKVAVVHALRDAFPDELGGMYCAEELGMEESEDNSIPAGPTADAVDAQYREVDPSQPGEPDQEEAQSSFFDSED